MSKESILNAYKAFPSETEIVTDPICKDNIHEFCREIYEEGYVKGAKNTIEKAVEWLKAHIDIPKDVAVNENGEPLADSYISYAMERLETANRIVEDFKSAMEQE